MPEDPPHRRDPSAGLDVNERVAALRLAYLFGGLPDEVLEDIARAATVLRPRRGQLIFGVGDPADGVYVVVSGSVRETAADADGGEIVFEVFTRGGVEGEPGTFSFLGTRMVNLTAVEDSVLLRISRDALLSIGWAYHDVIVRLLGGLAQQVRQSVDDQAALKFRRVRDRVALKLLWLAEAQGEPVSGRVRINLRMSQATLAAMAGTSREKTNGALRVLSEAGCIELTGGFFVVDTNCLARSVGEAPVVESRNRPPSD